MGVETRKLTEGALLSALQVVLGMSFVLSGVGYGVYMEMILPIMMAIIYLRCGLKTSILAGINTLLMITFALGDLVSAVYMSQALVFGLLCGVLIRRRNHLQDDLMLASLIGCAFLLILDFLTARLIGISLLDSEGLDEIIEYLRPERAKELTQIIFYMSIAAVPISSVLITYLGSLFVGQRLGVLKGISKQKYQLLRHYKDLYPYSYHSRKMSYFAIGGLLGCAFIWPFARGNYLKALVASSGIILLYFVLMDFMKLIDQYLVETGKTPIMISVLHIGVIFLLVKAFKLVSCSIILAGCMIDYKTPIRKRQQEMLSSYLEGGMHFKQSERHKCKI